MPETRVRSIQASHHLGAATTALSVARAVWLLLHPANWRREWRRLRRTVRHWRELHQRAQTLLTARANPCDNLSPAMPPTQSTHHPEDHTVKIEEQKPLSETATQQLTETPTETIDVEANAFTDFFTKTIPGFLGKHITADETKAAEQAVIAFVGKDGFALAVDAVKYVEVKYASVTGSDTTSADKLAEAKAKFKADAAEAKKDLTLIGAAALNFVIEGALQYAIGEAAKLAAKVALHAEAEPKA